MSKSIICFISIGSNMGNREHFINQAILEMSLHPEVSILKQGMILETAPLEITNQPDFLNCIVKIRTSLLPMDLLYTLQNIEQKIGRIKRYDKGPREIDLDILSYGNFIVNNERLQLPHHSLFTRPFIRDLLKEMNEEYLFRDFKDIDIVTYSQTV